MRDTVRQVKLNVSFPHQIGYIRLNGHTKSALNTHENKRQSSLPKNSDFQARKGLLQAASPSSSMTGIAEFAFTVYFRKLPYLGLNILRYPWADWAGHCRQGPAGSRAKRPRMDWDGGNWRPDLLWHFWGWG